MPAPPQFREKGRCARFWPCCFQLLFIIWPCFLPSASGNLLDGTSGQLPSEALRAPWFFDCSHNSEWDDFRRRFLDFRLRHSSSSEEERSSSEFIDRMMHVLMEANHLGRRSEASFVTWASSWGIYHMCNESKHDAVPEGLRTDFCFYGFVVVQWLGLFGQQRFGDTPGMDEWAHNARGFLNDASKFNAMHFLESSGWPLKLTELAQTLGQDYLGPQNYRPLRDGALPGLAALVASTPSRNQGWRQGTHLKAAPSRKLRAVAISYHTALLREPLSFWARALSHSFEVEATVHVLDVTANTSEDVARLHSHCKFIDGAWCATDPRLLRLNELFESRPLTCHSGDHKTGHHFIIDAEAFYSRFVEMFGKDESMHQADLLMCGEPVFFCRLLSYFGKPVVGYISTPLTVYVGSEDREQWYQHFYEMALDPRHFFAVTTPIFGEWIAYATGLELPVIRPAALYTEASYWPARQNEVLLLRTVSLFWDSECILNYFSKQAGVAAGGSAEAADVLRFVESTGLTNQERVGYAAFAEFLATVIFPYAFSQFWFYELYAMAVPLYMPSKETLPLFVNQDYACCHDFEGHRPGHLPFAIHPHSPFDTDDWQAMTYWTDFTDYMVTPHIQYFASLPQLLAMLQTANHREISSRMRAVQSTRVGQATTFWQSVLTKIAEWPDTDTTAASRQGRFAAAKAHAEAEAEAEADAAAEGEAAKTSASRGVGEEDDDRESSEDLSKPLADFAARLSAGEDIGSVLPDEWRDLSTRQPSGGSPARADGAAYKANDGDTDQQHPHEYHFDLDQARVAGGAGSTHWWVKLRRATTNPQVKLWPRNCCREAFGHRLWALIGNSSSLQEARECAILEVATSAMAEAICQGTGDHFFVEARSVGGWGYQDEGIAVLMLPEVRVLSRD